MYMLLSKRLEPFFHEPGAEFSVPMKQMPIISMTNKPPPVNALSGKEKKVFLRQAAGRNANCVKFKFKAGK